MINGRLSFKSRQFRDELQLDSSLLTHNHLDFFLKKSLKINTDIYSSAHSFHDVRSSSSVARLQDKNERRSSSMTAAHFLLHLVPPRVLLRFLWLLMIDYGSPAPAASLIFNGFRQAANFGQRSRQKKEKNQNSGGCLTLSGHIIITESTGSCSFFLLLLLSRACV